MADQLTGVEIIICMALGITTFILLFIFVKEQIVRFALKTRHFPNTTIAAEAPKHLRQEIYRRLGVAKEIKSEPQLINDDLFFMNDPLNAPPNEKHVHYFRMKAVDALPHLERAINDAIKDPSQRRLPGQDLRFFLLKQAKSGVLCGCDPKLINQFVDAYNHARHEPNPPFGKEEYKNFVILLTQIREQVGKKSPRSRKSTGSSSSHASPAKTPTSSHLTAKQTAAQMVRNGKFNQASVTLVDVREPTLVKRTVDSVTKPESIETQV